MFKTLATVFLSVFGGIAYRAGGSGRYPFYFRELGQAIAGTLEMIALGLIHWSLVLCFGLAWLQSTYFKKKGSDAVWWNWMLVGAVFGVIPLPYCIATNSHWLGFYIRLVICSAFTVLWQLYLSQKVADEINVVLIRKNKKPMGKDITDEFGRGFINIVTLPILLI